MAGEQSIQLINALAFARGTSEPTNRGVWWIDESITGNIYDKIKYFNTDSGEWELVQRSALQILEDLRGVDGEGSGLDADTLQGFTPAQLMSGGGGGSVPALSTGELLVGQGDTIGTAQTISGIATINTTGVLSYVNGSISHTGLSDIGTNTHAQIDTHIASTSNPHNVTAGQVGNTTAQWNADRIEGNITNIGTLGVGQDGQALTWDNATSRFVMASPSGQNFANTDLTVGAGREHTLTDTVRIKGGTFQVEGLNTLGTASAFEIYDGDTTPSKLWDWRNNGDVYLGAEQTLFKVASDSKTALGIWDRNGLDKQVKVGTGAFRDINELSFLATGRSSSGLLDSAFQFHDFIFEAPQTANFGIAGASGVSLNLHHNGGSNYLTSSSSQYGFNNQFRYFTSEETFWLGRGFVKEQSGNKRPNTMLHLFDYSQGGQGGLTFFVGDRTATGADSVLRGGQIRWDINTRNTTSFSNDFITLTPNGNATGNLYYAEFKNTSGSVALKINGNDALPQLPEFTVAGVPAADADNKGGFVCITDETGGYVTAFSDGTNWRRTTDRAIIS